MKRNARAKLGHVCVIGIQLQLARLFSRHASEICKGTTLFTHWVDEWTLCTHRRFTDGADNHDECEPANKATHLTQLVSCVETVNDVSGH